LDGPAIATRQKWAKIPEHLATILKPECGLDPPWLGCDVGAKFGRGSSEPQAARESRCRRRSAADQGWFAPEENPLGLSFGLKRLAFHCRSEIRGVAEVTAALRSACFQEAVAGRRSEQESTADNRRDHTQFSANHDTSFPAVLVAPCFCQNVGGRLVSLVSRGTRTDGPGVREVWCPLFSKSKRFNTCPNELGIGCWHEDPSLQTVALNAIEVFLVKCLLDAIVTGLGKQRRL